MASCPAKYSNNDDSLELLGHNPLKSSYDRHTSTNVSVPCFKNDTAFLFEVERNEIEGFDDDISSQLATDDSDSDTDSPYDPYDNDYDEESCNPQAQLSTAVSKVQIKLNNLVSLVTCRHFLLGRHSPDPILVSLFTRHHPLLGRHRPEPILVSLFTHV